MQDAQGVSLRPLSCYNACVIPAFQTDFEHLVVTSFAALGADSQHFAQLADRNRLLLWAHCQKKEQETGIFDSHYRFAPFLRLSGFYSWAPQELHFRLNQVYFPQTGHFLPFPPIPLLGGMTTTYPQLEHSNLEPLFQKVCRPHLGQIFPAIRSPPCLDGVNIWQILTISIIYIQSRYFLKFWLFLKIL